MENMIERAFRVHRIAEARSEREVVRRNGAKAGAYLRGLEVAEDSGIHGDSTPHDMALATAASHTFRRLGSDRTWSGQVGGSDYKDRKRQTTAKAVDKAGAMVDRRIKAERLAARTKRGSAPKNNRPQRIQVFHG